MRTNRPRRPPRGAQRFRWSLGSAVASFAIVVGTTACHERAIDFYPVDSCSHPDENHTAADGTFDPCHCSDLPDGKECQEAHCKQFPSECPTRDAGDGGDAGEDGPPPGCTGQCLPNPPLGWSKPVQLWFGEESGTPPCPDVAPAVGYEGHAGLNAAAPTCGACSCEPPQGGCTLPVAITANAASCGATDPLHADFDPPGSWEGTCTTNDAIPGMKNCDANPLPFCVKSMTTAPLTIDEIGCAPAPQPVPQGPSVPTWRAFGRACSGNTSGACASLGQTCGPAAADGFWACVFHEGDIACPGYTRYTDRHVFYAGFEDTRRCSPCTCGAPLGSVCSAMLSVYTDTGCSTLLLSKLIDSSAPLCDDVPAGAALGSKSIGAVTYTPGTCAPSGGLPIGAAEPRMPSTFCCLPPP